MGFDSDSDESGSALSDHTDQRVVPTNIGGILPTLRIDGNFSPGYPGDATPGNPAASDEEVELIEIAESLVGEPLDEQMDLSTSAGVSVSVAPLRSIPNPFGRRHDEAVVVSKSTPRTDDVSGSSQLVPLVPIDSHETVAHNCRMPNDRDWTCQFDGEGKVPLWDSETI